MGDLGSNYNGGPFVALEGGYSRNSLDGYDFVLLGLNSSVVSTQSNSGYTGRLAAGLIGSINEELAVSGELGWGYYGSTNSSPSYTNFSPFFPGTLFTKNTITGFDALVGVAYTQPCFSLFLKGGALVETLSTKTEANFVTLNPTFFASAIIERNHTEVLPEVKVGGAYHFDNNWALTAAYMHAFGSKVKTTGTYNVQNLLADIRVNAKNPSLNTALVGIQYTF